MITIDDIKATKHFSTLCIMMRSAEDERKCVVSPDTGPTFAEAAEFFQSEIRTVTRTATMHDLAELVTLLEAAQVHGDALRANAAEKTH